MEISRTAEQMEPASACRLGAILLIEIVPQRMDLEAGHSHRRGADVALKAGLVPAVGRNIGKLDTG